MEKQNSSVFELSPLARRARAVEGNDTPLDGDTVFAAATGTRALLDPIWILASLGALAADVLARAVARGVNMAASSVGLADMPPSWKDRFGR
jgi:D-aminopeptidase